MPSPIVSSLGMLAVRLLAADSLEVGAMPPVLGAAVSLVEVLLAAVPVVVLAFAGTANGTTSPVAVFS
jgi:hypothetical protein